MRTTPRTPIVRMLGFSLLGALLVRGAWEARRETPRSVAACPARPGAPASPAAAALRTARWSRLRALQAADGDRYRMEAWDPEGTAALNFETWRLQLLAGDRTGDLARSRREALAAAALATSPQEAALAAELLALIEHERADHAAELAHARRLVRFQPDGSRGRSLLRRALRCTQGL